MVLFVSDMHFGRSDPARERAKEADLVACLQAQDGVEALYLVGDVFDEYIEYRTLIPKGFVRFQALLAAWTDRGVPVTYLVGNHDPWHRDYFARELGVEVVFDALVASLHGRTVYLTHGDGRAPSQRLYRRLKPWLRHPVPVWLYRSLLPGDAGFRLARWFNRRYSDNAVNPVTVGDLRAEARRLLAETPADVVVMGHTHRAELHTWPEGTYVNTGSWDGERTFACLCNDKLSLLRWNGERAVAVDPETTPLQT